MAKLPTKKVAWSASFRVFALIGAVLIGPAPIAGASVDAADAASVHVATFEDSNDPDQDPSPLIQDPPEVQGPSSPGQKTLAPQHRRSHHRAPTST
jgi:hypothetical protein